MTNLNIASLVDKTCSGYSFDRYGLKGWEAAIKALHAEGLSDYHIELWMMSKHTRWAADSGNDANHGNLNGAKLVADYIAQYPKTIGNKSLAELAAQ